MHKYAREAFDLGVRYIGGCCGFEPYHIRWINCNLNHIHRMRAITCLLRAVAEELAKERGKMPAGSEKHMPWGQVSSKASDVLGLRSVGNILSPGPMAMSTNRQIRGELIP